MNKTQSRLSGDLAPPERQPLQRICVFCGASHGRRTEYRDAAVAVGMDAVTAGSVVEALSGIAATSPEARVLICGSLYLAGTVLRENG